MNCANYLNTRMFVVLNDNGQVSLPTGTPSAGGTKPAGELSAYTSRLLTSKPFKDFRDVAKQISSFLPGELQDINAKIDEYARGMLSEAGTLFEELGFYYVGPIDGHDLENMVQVLENLRDNTPPGKPVLLHLKTEKGFGYAPAMAASDKMHGVAKYDVATGKQFKGKGGQPSYTSVFANELVKIAEQDPSVVGITAAMPGGTGMDIFGRRFPKRTYDVGIAEQHAVTFAAGLAVEGLKPFCCIYSTFMQRGHDQLVHDVVIQNLPVRFILDRAGLVGNDGPTHHGAYDLAYLGCMPDLVIMAPAHEVDLMNMLATAADFDEGPIVLRYPRGVGYAADKLQTLFGYDLRDGEVPTKGVAIDIGKGRIIREPGGIRTLSKPEAVPANGSTDSTIGAGSRGETRESRVAILSIGSRLSEALIAADELEESYPNLAVTVADARFMKPLDEDLVLSLAADNGVIVTVEEGSVGGFGDHVLHFLSHEG